MRLLKIRERTGEWCWWRDSQVGDDACGTHGCDWNVVTPEAKDDIQGRNLEGNGYSFIKKEVEASREPEGLVNPLASPADEAAADRHKNAHLSHGVIDHGKNTTVDDKGKQQTNWSALIECRANADEESRADGAADGEELHLTVADSSAEAIVVAHRRLSLKNVVAVCGRG